MMGLAMDWYEEVGQEVKAVFHEGMNAIGQGRYHEAHDKLVRAAKAGHKEAKRYLDIFTRAGAFADCGSEVTC